MVIRTLNHTDIAVAEEIHCIFQGSYRVEASLINVENFPPLDRTIKDIAKSQHQFLGLVEEASLAAVAEISLKNKELSIHSLTVAPRYFRKGFAGQLLRYTLDSNQHEKAVVETAQANYPAISLYEKMGFVEYQRWIPSHGIPKTKLKRISL